VNEPVRVGFLGAGLIATFHSKMLRAAGGAVERAGVHDPDGDRAATFARASGHRWCATEEEVLDTCDAVYVCTWTSAHPRLVRAAAERGLHVFCEKPLAVDLAAAQQMADDVTTAGVHHQVGLVLRRSPSYLFARQLIDDPAAGRVMAVVFRDDQFIPIQGHYGSDWRADQQRAGAGTLLEHSIHDVDMLRFLVGDVAAVSAQQSSFHGLEGIEDVVSASMRFAGGATGTLTSVWHDNLARPSLRRVEVFCERRHVVIEGDDWFGPVSWTDHDGRSGSTGGDGLVTATLAAVAGPTGDGDHNPDVAFIRSIRTGTPAWPDFHTAVEAHRIVDALYRAAEEQTVVEL
jgi:predicted dehydrogenase